MKNTRKSTEQLFEELTKNMSLSDREKLIILGDKLFSKGEKSEYKRIKTILEMWNKFNNDIEEEVDDLISRIKEYWE